MVDHFTNLKYTKFASFQDRLATFFPFYLIQKSKKIWLYLMYGLSTLDV